MCTQCMLRYRPILARSLVIGLIVGTILTLINHGSDLFSSQMTARFIWQIPLNFNVPFAVSTTSALMNTRSRTGSSEERQ